MKNLLLTFLLFASMNIQAQTESKSRYSIRTLRQQLGITDNLRGFRGDLLSCGIELVAQLPEEKQICRVIIKIDQSDMTAHDYEQQTFGKIENIIKLDSVNQYTIISVITLKQLLKIQYDERILLAPDRPMGGVGGFTVTN